MKNSAIIFLLTLTILFGCRDKKRYNDKGLSEYQIEMNNFFKDASTSPLKRKDCQEYKRVFRKLFKKLGQSHNANALYKTSKRLRKIVKQVSYYLF